jgi:hypothetical protein
MPFFLNSSPVTGKTTGIAILPPLFIFPPQSELPSGLTVNQAPVIVRFPDGFIIDFWFLRHQYQSNTRSEDLVFELGGLLFRRYDVKVGEGAVLGSAMPVFFVCRNEMASILDVWGKPIITCLLEK